ncbi:MAG: YggS family pyridoxal phosphate-dependent enzyme, partial [Bdellovibrionaceae bacterium]|nr:YggS family pyridoxal phosphate-dependent enzyme [Pseudobdellovibrionaceae bacterium]
MSLEQNLKSVLSVIDHSKSRSAFDGEIKLIAVSKFQSINKIKELYALGHRRFGENYLQELEEKSEKLPDDIEWHFIGAIQSKKIKKIVGRVDYIHSVESIKHLEKIESVCIEQNLTQNVLLQVNIAQEESKSGFSVGKIGEVIRFANELKATTVVGLMAMPPLVGNAEANR